MPIHLVFKRSCAWTVYSWWIDGNNCGTLETLHRYRYCHQKHDSPLHNRARYCQIPFKSPITIIMPPLGNLTWIAGYLHWCVILHNCTGSRPCQKLHHRLWEPTLRKPPTIIRICYHKAFQSGKAQCQMTVRSTLQGPTVSFRLFPECPARHRVK